MDAAGVGIGTVALFSLFKTCLDMYDTLECGRRYGADYEVLTTKVGVERVRLSIWGDTVGLPGLGDEAVVAAAPGGPQTSPETGASGVDPRLHDPRIVKAVFDILHCMQQLFEDTSSLTRRYGLQATSSSPSSSAAGGVATLASQASGSNALVTTFRSTYTRLQGTQRSASLMTSARWAIKDKKRFQRFVDDLRSFNDGLNGLFPDVGATTQGVMLAEIKAATDLDNLQIVEQAVVDMEEQKELAEAASMRITEISQYTKSLIGEDVDTETLNAGELGEASSMIHAGSINVTRLARQLERLDVALRKDLKGSLQLSIWKSWGVEYHGFLTWEGIRDDEYYAEIDRAAEYVKHPHLAWSLMHVAEKKGEELGDFARQDSEASRKFEGKFPGTRSVMGYAADFSAWARIQTPETERFSFKNSPLPELTLSQVVDWLQELQRHKSLPWGQTDEQAGKDLTKLLGPAGTMNPVSGVKYDMSLQIIDLLATVNRTNDFDDVRDAGSLGSIALTGRGLLNFLYQIIVAYELKLRMDRIGGDHAFGGLTKRAVATIQAADRWMEGVLVRLPDAQKENVELHSLVHERQVEGLIRFAEMLSWPSLGEMREFIEDAYANLRAGRRITISLWDWLFGMTLPGNKFAYTIMNALVAATPSIASLGGPQYFESGLALDERSYWRAKYVVGRVLGGIRGIRAANGWIGPCPIPIMGAGDGEKVKRGWWRVQARDTAFALKERIPSHVDGDESGLFSDLNRVGGESSRAEWVRTVADPSKWVIPVGPSHASDVVAFRALRLKKPDRNTISNDIQGIGPSTGGEDKQAAPDALKSPAENDEAGEETQYRAVLELTINQRPVSFILYNNPVFIAAPRCVDGPHAVHERDVSKLQHIIGVSQLPGHLHTDDRVLIIDATGQGEAELAARAWCAEFGQHAIVRRGGGTCFACAVRAAGAEGLGVGCLIWT